MIRVIAAFMLAASLLAATTGNAANLSQAAVLQLMDAAGMALKGGEVVNPCGHATGPKLKFIDLSGDGQPEAVSMDHDPACYGPDPGYQSKLLVRDRQGRWQVVAAMLGIFKPLKTRSHGWADFTLAGHGCQPVWHFDGRTYVATTCDASAAPAVADAAPPAAGAPVAAVPQPTGTPDNDMKLFPENFGSFAPGGDCGTLPRVTVSAEGIRLETQAGNAMFGKPMVTTNFGGPEDESITYYTRGADVGLELSVLRNDLASVGGEKLSGPERAVDAASSQTPLKRCGKQVPEPQPEAPPQMRTSAARRVDDFKDLGAMLDPGFKAAYLKAMGPLARQEYWLVDMEGPGSQDAVTVAGARYVQVAVCKTHDCGDNAMLVIYRPDTGALYGLVSVHRKRMMVGHPPAVLVPAIKQLFQKEWPAG